MFLVDSGSEFDAPLETVWAYLSAPGEHRLAHPKTRNFEVTEASDSSFVLAMEQWMQSRWVRTVGRGAVFPPLGSSSEALEGPLAGSKYFLYYTPKGAKTGVTVVGHFVSPDLSDAEVQPMVLGLFEEFFNEDQARIRAFRQRSAAATAPSTTP